MIPTLQLGQFGLRRQGATVPLDPDAVTIWPKINYWYEHSETSGTVLVDSHTGGLNGTYSGAITLNQSAIAAGLSPCASYTASTAVSLVPHNAALDLAATYSVMVWFRRNGAQAAFAKILWKPTDLFNGKGTYFLGYANATGKLLARFDSGGVNFDINGATTIANLTAYQVIFTKNTTGSQLFLNNVSDGTQASGGAPDTGVSALRQGESNGSDGLIGDYSATAGFNAPLTTSERAYLYNAGAGRNYATVKAQSGH